jgi:hypothetical protein
MKEFCIEAYQKLLVSLRDSGVQFRSFAEEPREGLLLRLDVDFDLDWAASLAVENQKLGIQGTFFVQVASPFYNTLTPEGRQALQQITEAGQKLGLHYYHQGGRLDVERLKHEYELLLSISPSAEQVVAWHNPDGPLEPLIKGAHEAGFLSTYMNEFYGVEKYVSDSNCERLPTDILNFARTTASPLVQVLLHPVIWVMGGNSMPDVLRQAFKAKFDKLAEIFASNRVWKNGFGREIMAQVSASPWYAEE